MSGRLVRPSLLLAVLVSCAPIFRLAAQNLPEIVCNDNRSPAGELRNGVLTVRLEIGQGNWRPEGEHGEVIPMYAFGVAGKPLQAPGPLIRVPQGTEVAATVHNGLPMAVMVRGLHERPGKAGDAITLQPGAMQEVRFQAGAPGTYYYWATTTGVTSIANLTPVETELAGALVVDPPGATVRDRVFVIGRRSGTGIRPVLTINGKSWPYTEHFTFTEGDTTHWRWVNTSTSAHSMHMHGFYYHVDAVSNDGEKVQPFSDTDPPLLVTQRIPTGGTFDMTLNAEHPGRWLFHCHMFAHMTPHMAMGGLDPAAEYDSGHKSEPGSAGMAGLVLGITVLPKRGASPPAWKPERRLQVALEEHAGKQPAYTVAVRDSAKPAAPPAPTEAPTPPQLMGPPIVLRQGQATEIEVINRMSKPTAIHWHGMELDSYYDGVAGWGGNGQRTAPPIPAGGSFVAKIAPLRAGSFIYHTHWHDPGQLMNGIYGPLIVMPAGKEFDTATDLNFLFSFGTFEPFGDMVLINGHPQPLVLPLKTGVKYHFRLTNITPNAANLRVALKQLSGAPVKWRILAKDGADLPATATITKTADQFITVGETYDFEYQADEPQELSLEIYLPLPISKVRAVQGIVFSAP
jgi:FtsP/CotA-like multicopper oxidase with cupredoxin domain